MCVRVPTTVQYACLEGPLPADTDKAHGVRSHKRWHGNCFSTLRKKTYRNEIRGISYGLPRGDSLSLLF